MRGLLSLICTGNPSRGSMAVQTLEPELLASGFIIPTATTNHCRQPSRGYATLQKLNVPIPDSQGAVAEPSTARPVP
jgi:hypothetical protein